MKITIAAINLQSAVATTRGYYHYPLTTWKYWLPHSHKPLKICGDMIQHEHVDIACITEISESSVRTGFRSQTKALAEYSKMKHSHFFSMQKWAKFFMYEGNAIASCYPLSDFSSHLLPIELMYLALERSVVTIGMQKITVLIGHLALGKNLREKQIQEIINLVKEEQNPVIFAGDFNEPDPRAFNELRERTPLKQLCTAKTFPIWKPNRSLDYILVSNEFTVLDSYVPQCPAFSDHAPLIVKAELTI